MAKQKIEVSATYLIDGTYEAKTIEKTTEFEPFVNATEASKELGDDFMEVLNLGYRAWLESNLRASCVEDFPLGYISETAYQNVFASFRSRLEALGIEGIKNLRAEFLSRAKSNPKIAAQIRAQTEAESIEI